MTQMIHSPFEQFKIFTLFGYDYNFVITNSTFQLICVLTIFFTFSIAIIYQKKRKYEINYYTLVIKAAYQFFFETIASYVGKHVNIYFPFMFYLFFFIFICNLVGLLPYSFTITSHLAVTFGLAFIVWYGIFLICIEQWDLKFFALFFPKGIAIPLVFLLALIEFVSYMFRVASLALRLLANMIAGHILLDCLAFYIYKLLYESMAFYSIKLVTFGYIIIPIIFLVILLAFETVVALLQAYIFVILSSIYLKEVL